MQVIWNDGDIARIVEFCAKGLEVDYPIIYCASLILGQGGFRKISGGHTKLFLN